MKVIKIILAFISILFTVASAEQKVRLGNERLVNEYFRLIEGKRVGVIANHTSLLSSGEHLIDFLLETKKINVVAAFGPEHGFRGSAPAGIKIETIKDENTGIPIYSLYGKTTKPTPMMLKDIDVLIYDIQDVGARFYTYISTLYLCMEAAAENDIEFIVCDRPNPIGGEIVDGPVLKTELKSFVGIAPLPIQHGMTIGELAQYFNDLIEKETKKKVKLTVIKMEGWTRKMLFPETGLTWINPSPNIVNFWTASIYPGTCLFEATNVSEGRGTEMPFTTIGAPFINSENWIHELAKLNFKSLQLRPIQFKPIDIEGMAKNPKYKGEICNGIDIQIETSQSLYPVQFGLALISTLKQLYPDKFEIKKETMNRLVGDKNITELLNEGTHYTEIIKLYQDELSQFKIIRSKYLLYN